MKINAQELVLLNRRNMKNDGSTSQPTVETAVTNPEETMKALALQGVNNISFQKSNVVAKKILKPAAIAIGTALAALSTQSCNPDLWNPDATLKYPANMPKDTTIINVTQQVTVNTTVTIIKQSDELLAILMQMLNNTQQDNAELRAQIATLIEEIQGLREDVNKGLADVNAAQKQTYEQQLQTFALMQLMYKNDVEMAEKLDAIKVRIEDIEALIEAGNLSYAEASKEIQKLLESLNGKLDGILGILYDVRGNLEKLVDQGKLNNTQNELIAAKLDNLLLLVEKGQIEDAKAFIELYSISSEILNQLIENNKYNSEELAMLSKVQTELANILIEVQKGNMDVQTGFDKINKILGQISGQITDIQAMLHGELNKINTQLNTLVEQGHINIAQNQSLQAQLTNLVELVEKGQIAEAEAFAKMYDINKAILNQLIVNNMQNAGIQSQLYGIQAELNSIENAIKNGTLTYEEGNKQIQELIGNLQTELEGINGSLDEIKAMLHGELNKINTQLNTLVEQGHINIAQNQSLQAQLTNLVELIEKGQIDQAKALAGIYDLNKAILEQMIENNRYNGAFKEVLGQVQQDLANIENAIKDQEINVEVGTDQLEVLIENLSSQLEKIQATLDSILKEVSLGFGMVDAYNKSYQASWNKLMDWMSNFNGDLAALNQNQKDIKTYLDEQLKQLYAIKDYLKNLDTVNGGNGQGSSGLTVQQLKDMLQDLGNYYYAAFENFVKNNLPDNAKIEDLLASIDKKMDNLKQPLDYSKDLAKITSLLEKLAAQPDYNEKLDEIIKLLKEFKCNCECGGSNEGIVGDLEDLLK